MSEPVAVPIDSVVLDSANYVREFLDAERVEMFEDVMQSGEVLPPLEVVRYGDRFLLADGWHRRLAAKRLGHQQVSVVVVEPADAEDAAACAFRRGLETSTTSAKPLTRSERRHAALKLLAERPDLSHRAVAAMVGVSRRSVDGWAICPPADHSGSERAAKPPPTADECARALVTRLAGLAEARGLRDYAFPNRMGRHLAQAFEWFYGDEALDQAERFAAWTNDAVETLAESGNG